MVGAGAIGSVLTIAIASQMHLGTQVVTLTAASDAPGQAITKVRGLAPSADIDFSVPAERALNSVVHIKNTAERGAGRGPKRGLEDMFGFDGGDDIQRFFFGPQTTPMQPAVSTGSGVIIDKSGYIVTNNHVVDNSRELEVTLHDNRTFKAKVIGTDPSTDLAVIQIKGADLTPIVFGNSDATKVGQWVLAVGNPFNLSSTVTAGVISAKARNIGVNRSNYAIESFIQTDAAVNPGNSGGALVDLNGNLIGINTAIASPTGSYAGYSFAVPGKIVEKIVKDLIAYGSVQRGVLGIRIRNLDSKLVKEKELAVNDGVYVDTVFEKSSAADAGIKSGDVITKIGNQTIKTSAELQEAIARLNPGDKVNVEYLRGESTKTASVVLKTAEGKTSLALRPEATSLGKLGAELKDLTEAEKNRLKLKGGVKVKSLSSGVLRNQTQMTEGFVITKVDKKPVLTVKEFEKMLESIKGPVLIEGIYPQDNETAYYGFNLAE